MKLSKIQIEEFANEIVDFLMEEEYENDVSIYFNNKKISFKCYDDNWKRFAKSEVITTENASPLDCFKYANVKHILSMSFEGALYTELNYGYGHTYNALEKIFNKYNLYFEQGNAWNLTAYPNSPLEYSDIEYTDYSDKIKGESIVIGMNKKANIPQILVSVMDIWYNLSEKYGDIGSCIIGAGFEFEYENKKYLMAPCSPYQGSCSWESAVNTIETILDKLGAEKIKYNWGVMD